MPIWEAVFGAEHASLASTINNLAVLNYSRGDLKKAEPLYARALAIWEKVFEPDHPGATQDAERPQTPPSVLLGVLYP